MIKLKTDDFHSSYKTVEGNEGDKCNYPTRLDTYGKGCYFNCKYCYAKNLLDFRGLWNPIEPGVADIKDIANIIKKVPSGSVLRLGGMTDCFQPKERIKRITYKTIKLLNKKKIHQLIVTKNDLITRPEYMKILDPQLAHIQVSITSTNDKILELTDNAPNFERRKQTIETLYEAGYDTSIRLSPLLYPHVDFQKINNINCNKILVEFLRLNNKMIKDMKGIINPKMYTVHENGYLHLPLLTKIRLLKQVKKPQITICDDVTQHYTYFKQHINHNPEDCCNLTLETK